MSAELEKIAGQLDRIVEILELLHKIKEREREKFPKTLKEKGKETPSNNNNNPRARACEKFVKPMLEEVADYIRENGFAALRHITSRMHRAVTHPECSCRRPEKRAVSASACMAETRQRNSQSL